MVPCLNDHPVWLDGMTAIIREELGSWLEGEARKVNDCAITCPLKRVA